MLFSRIGAHLLASFPALRPTRRNAVLLAVVLLVLPTVAGCGGESSSDGGGGSEGPPSAPTGFSVSPGDGQVILSWNAVSGASGYNVYRSTISGVTPATGMLLNGGSLVTTGSYTDTTVSNGTAYYYVVTAVNAGGESVASAEVSATPQVPAPDAPSGLSASPGDGQVILSWNGVAGATGYNLYWGTSAGVTPATGTQIAGVTSPYPHTGRMNGTTYYYAVTAVNEAGESAASVEVDATPLASGSTCTDFSTGLGAFTVRNGLSAVAGGELRLKSTSGNRGFVTYDTPFDPATEGPLDVTFRMRVASGAEQGHFAWRSKVDTAGSYYLPSNAMILQVYDSNPADVRLAYYGGTGRQYTAVGPTAWDFSSMRNVRVRDDGSNVQVWIDGTLIFDVTLADETFAFSSLGFLNRENNLGGGNAFVDDVCISMQPGASPPGITGTVPADAATNVDVASPISVTFAGAMDTAATEAAFSISPSVPGDFAWSAGDTVLTFAPAGPLAYATTYAVTVGTGAQDAVGTRLPQAYQFQFATVADSISPTVGSTSPAHGDTLVSSGATISVTFSEPMDTSSGGAQVTIEPSPTVYQFAWSNLDRTYSIFNHSGLLQNTDYTVTVDPGLTDLAGNPLGTPYVFKFTTASTIDITSPSVTGTSPVPEATNVALDGDIVITFSEAMDGTATFFAFNLNPGVSGSSSSLSPDQTVFTYSPTVPLAPETTYTVTIGQGATDLAGNPLDASLQFSFTTGPAPDTTAPTILGTQPANGATGVNVDTDIVVTFSEAMDTTIAQSSFGTTPATTGSFTWTAGNTVMTFNPDAPLAYDTNYTVAVGTGAKDAAGNNLAAPYEVGFTTGPAPDTDPPSITGTNPAASATDVDLTATIAVTFSEAMNTSVAQAAFSTSPALTGSFAWSAGDTVLTFTPDTPLTDATTYTVTIGTGAVDVAGNGLAAPYAFSFTTVRLVSLSISSSGVVSSVDAPTLHGSMNTAKNLMVWTMTDGGGGSSMYLLFKEEGPYATADLNDAWTYHDVLTGDGPAERPGWAYGTASIDASGNVTFTSPVTDSLGANTFTPGGFQAVVNSVGGINIAGLTDYAWMLSADKSVSALVFTGAPGEINDVYGHTLSVFLKPHGLAFLSDLNGSWYGHGLVAGDSVGFLGWLHGPMTIDNGSYAFDPVTTPQGSGGGPSGSVAMDLDGTVTFGNVASSHGTLNYSAGTGTADVIAMTMDDGGGGSTLLVFLRQDATTPFAATDLGGKWRAVGVTSGDNVGFLGWTAFTIDAACDGTAIMTMGIDPQSGVAPVCGPPLLQAVDGDSGDEFGKTIDVAGDYMIAGAPSEDGGDGNGLADAGAAYVYHRDPATGSWDAGVKLQSDVPEAGAGFGSAVATDGVHAIVGAPGEGGTNWGGAYVFERTGLNAWTLVTHFTGSSNTSFGSAVEIDGPNAAVGAWRASYTGCSQCGVVEMYRLFDAGGTTSWMHIMTLEPDFGGSPTGENLAQFGYSVALSGDRLVVGQPSVDNGALDAGMAYAYSRLDEFTWGDSQLLLPPTSEEGGLFGVSVAIDGDYLAVGSARAGQSGRTYVHHWDSGGFWSIGSYEVAPLDGHNGDGFGLSVALLGDRLLVGSPSWRGSTETDPNVYRLGAAYVFTRIDVNTWTAGPMLRFTAPETADDFGYDVGVGAGNDFVGVPGDNGMGSVFRFQQ